MIEVIKALANIENKNLKDIIEIADEKTNTNKYNISRKGERR